MEKEEKANIVKSPEMKESMAPQSGWNVTLIYNKSKLLWFVTALV